MKKLPVKEQDLINRESSFAVITRTNWDSDNNFIIDVNLCGNFKPTFPLSALRMVIIRCSELKNWLIRTDWFIDFLPRCGDNFILNSFISQEEKKYFLFLYVMFIDSFKELVSMKQTDIDNCHRFFELFKKSDSFKYFNKEEFDLLQKESTENRRTLEKEYNYFIVEKFQVWVDNNKDICDLKDRIMESMEIFLYYYSQKCIVSKVEWEKLSKMTSVKLTVSTKH